MINKPRLSGTTASKTLSHYFTSLSSEKKELFLKKVFANISEDCTNDLINYIDDPKKISTQVGNFFLHEIVEIEVASMSYTMRRVFTDAGCTESAYVKAEIVDFNFNSSIDLMLKVVVNNKTEIFQAGGYSVRKLELL